MQGSSHRALGQRQREDSGPKSSSFETSYFVSTRDTLPVTLPVSQENRSVSRLICNRNCMSRNHLPKQRPDNCFQCKGCFCFFVFFFKAWVTEKVESIPAHTPGVCNLHYSPEWLFAIHGFTSSCPRPVSEDWPSAAIWWTLLWWGNIWLNSTGHGGNVSCQGLKSKWFNFSVNLS